MSKHHDFGCHQCGLIGCECPPVEPPVQRAGPGGGVCGVCHRGLNQCLCESHHSVKHVFDVETRARRDVSRPYSEAHLNALSNEALVFYYNRDAEGLVRWLRNALR